MSDEWGLAGSFGIPQNGRRNLRAVLYFSGLYTLNRSIGALYASYNPR